MGRRVFSYWGLGWELRDVLQNSWLSYDFMVIWLELHLCSSPLSGLQVGKLLKVFDQETELSRGQ